MFSKLVLVVSVAVLAAATPLPGASQCDTGSMQCCDSVQSASAPVAAGLLSELGINAQDVTGQVGVTCSPVTVSLFSRCIDMPVDNIALW